MINILYLALITLSAFTTNADTNVVSRAQEFDLQPTAQTGNLTEFNSILNLDFVTHSFSDVFIDNSLSYAFVTENQTTNLFTIKYDIDTEKLVFTTNTDYLINYSVYVRFNMDLNPGSFNGYVYLPLWNDTNNDFSIDMTDIPTSRACALNFSFYEIPEDIINAFNGEPGSATWWQGYNKGYDDAIDDRINAGYIYNEVDLAISNQAGFDEGRDYGFQEGYDEASQELNEQNTTATLIFTGILSVGMLPVNVFLQILNFEIFGINIAGFISGLLSVCIIVIIFRVILGGKSDKNG